MAQFPSVPVAQKSYDFRTLGLGYANLGSLLMQQGIRNPAAIEAAIKQFATDLGPAGRDDEFGFGLVNPPATLRGLGLIR